MIVTVFRPNVPKALLFFLALCLPQSVFSQNGLSWSPPVPVAAASFGDSSPRMALLSDGTPVVVWGKPATVSQIWCARWMGTGFSAPVLVNTGSVAPGIYEFGGLDVAIAGQRVFVVFEDFDQGIFLARSEDGGASWLSPVTVFATPPGMGNTISAISTDATGNPIVTFLLQTSSETDAHVHLARSTDGGLTFTNSTNASAPAGDNGQACECCYQDILTTGSDTVFVAFRANQDNLRDMWVTRSSDNAGTFDTACDVDAQDWTISACPFSGPRLARLAGDSLLAVWMSRGSGVTRVYASTLHGGTMSKGVEFGFPGSSGAAGFNQNHPDVAGRQDTVAMIWEESGFTGTGQDLVCAFSTTGANGLATNLAALSDAGAQQFPQLAYANGVFHLLYVNSAQGLAYRQGTVVAPSSTNKAVFGKNPVLVFPNPVCDFLNMQTDIPGVSVEIISISGESVLTAPVKQGELQVSGLSPGFYFLKTFNEMGVLLNVQKFVKQ
jgi:hypothetical protein